VKRFLLGFRAAAFVLLAPAVTWAEPSSGAYGAGPNGYDWQIGTWSCTNPTPSAISGPAKQTQTVTKISSGALLFHTIGANFQLLRVQRVCAE
jgi:hypothetical protein